jgi:hypothetical protein
MQTKRSSGALPCPARAGGVKLSVLALPIRPLSQSQLKREEALKRQAWGRYRSWSRVTSGVLLSVIGAVQYGTSKVFYKIVPHFDAQEFRQYMHQVMATFSKIGTEVVMVVDRSGIHRAHKLDATLDHYRVVYLSAADNSTGPTIRYNPPVALPSKGVLPCFHTFFTTS